MRALFVLLAASAALAACDPALLAPPPADASMPPGITFRAERETYPVGATVSVVLVNRTARAFTLPNPIGCLRLEGWSGQAWTPPSEGDALFCATVVEEVVAGQEVRAEVPATPPRAGTYRVAHGFSAQGLRTASFVVE